MFNKGKGDILVFEDEKGTGASELFFSSELNDMINDIKQSFLKNDITMNL